MAKASESTFKNVRARRLSALLSEIWYEGSISRSRLGKITGMALPSVSRLVQDLKNAGVIVEIDKGESSGGRQPSLIRVNPDAGVVIGLDFSGIELRGAVLDANNHCLNVRSQPFQGTRPDIFLDQVVKLCKDLSTDPSIQGRRILGIGISVPGAVDTVNGIIRDSSNLRLRDYPIRDKLQSAMGLPVFIEHDTTTAALAEKYYGAGRGEANMIYIIVSTGIGAEIIFDHKVYRGASGLAGELGHVTVERDGQVCSCGRQGCLEAVAAIPAMLTSAHNILLSQKSRPINGLSVPAQDMLSLSSLIQAVEGGDRLVQAIITRAADYLALAISTMVSIVDIRLIIIGGEVVQMGEHYFSPLRESLQQYQDEGEEIRVVSAALGDNAALQGISMTVLQNTLT